MSNPLSQDPSQNLLPSASFSALNWEPQEPNPAVILQSDLLIGHINQNPNITALTPNPSDSLLLAQIEGSIATIDPNITLPNDNSFDGLTGEAMDIVKEQLTQFAKVPNFVEKMNLAFGESWDNQAANVLTQDWLNGDFSSIPPVKFVSSAEIAGANGAFAQATNTIYLSQKFLRENATNSQAIADVLLEEIGHSIDSKINVTDSPGDEGAIFTSIVQGKSLSQEKLTFLKEKDDHALVTIEGQNILIEKSYITSPISVNSTSTNATGYFPGRKLLSSQSVSNFKYYSLNIPSIGGRLSVGLKDIYGTADIALIRDSNNNGYVDFNEILANSEGRTDKLLGGGSLDNLSSGNYFVRVKGNANYGITFNLDQAGNSRSPGIVGVFSNATARNLGTLTDRAALEDYQYTDFVGSTLGDTVDYYSFRLDKSRRLDFALRDLTGNANVYLEDANGQVLAKSENSGTAWELSNFNLQGNTTYYIRVSPATNTTEFTNYRLVLNPGAEITSPAPILTTQSPQYFRDRPQFYMQQGNGYAQHGYGSSVLGNNSFGQEGNCTWYAYGRLKELGFNPNDIMNNYPNAYEWLPLRNGSRVLSTGETPRLGDVAQWYLNGQNHVAIVEKVENEYVWLSESNWATDKDGDMDRDGRTTGDGTFHNIVQYTVNNAHRYIRLTKS